MPRLSSHRRVHQRHLLVLAAALTTPYLAPSPTPAATWTNPAGGSWSTTANWSPASVPNSNVATATFNLGATAPDFAAYPGYTLSLPTTLSLSTLTVQTDKVTLSQPSSATTTISNLALAIAASQSAAVTLTGGTFNFNGSPPFPGLSGIATAGTAALNVSANTKAYFTNGLYTADNGGTATITVSGPSSTIGTHYIYLSNYASGFGPGGGTSFLNITNGGSVTGYPVSDSINNGISATFGIHSGSATVTIDGVGSSFGGFDTTTFGYDVYSSAGLVGTGSLVIKNGGKATMKNGLIGDLGGTGSVSVDGPTSTLSGYLNIGSGGNSPTRPSHGTLTATNGAVINASLDIAYGGSYGVGAVTLASGSTLSASSLHVGGNYAGQGTLDIRSGATVTTTSSSSIGVYPSAYHGAGTVTIGSDTSTPSKWTSHGSLIINNGSLIVNTGGQVATDYLDIYYAGSLILHGGAVSITQDAAISGGTITGWGTVQLPTRTSLSLLENSCTIAPEGTLALDLNLDLSSSDTTLLAFDLTSPTAYDRLTSIHKLTFGGTLAVSLDPAYTPQLGDSFALLDFATRSGSSTFASLSLPPLPPGLAWDTSALYSTGTLSVALPEPTSLAACGLASLLPLTRRRRRRT